MGGRGIFEPQDFFFVIKFLVWIFLGIAWIFFSINWLAWFFFHLIFPCPNIFFVRRPSPRPPVPPDKFSNGPSLNKIISAVLYFTFVSWLVYICASEWTNVNRAASTAVSLVSSVTQAVSVNFWSEVIFFPFVSTSLACITIPKDKRKTKITWDKKLTTTDIFSLVNIW